jgi:hypothetical protein
LTSVSAFNGRQIESAETLWIGQDIHLIDIHKDDAIEEAALKELIRAAVALNAAKRTK